VIEDDYIASNLRENNPFVLIFSKEIEEENNNSDINIDNFFMGVFTTFPLPLEYGEYVDIFSELEVR